MSVLIKGYEKPKRCVECIACFAKMCLLKKSERCPLDGVPEWCPMVEILMPHGKLIDAEDLIKMLDIHIEIDGLENAKNVTRAFNEFIDTIRGMSAVIEEEI